MIFRRIKAHVEKENWFAVFVDFCIVVVGVFIGIQVANWNEARQASREELAIISQLTSDFQAHEDLLMERIARSERLTTQTGELVKLIQTGDEPEHDSQVEELISAAMSISYREAPPASYSALLASGKLSDITDGDLRTALVKYGQIHALWNYVDGVVPAQKSEDSTFRQALSFKLDGGLDVATPAKIRSFDWNKLKEAEVSVGTIRMNQWMQLDRHQSDLDAVRAIIAELEKQ